MEQLVTDQQLEQFHIAHQIAVRIQCGFMRRARHNGQPTNYRGYKDCHGQMWVIGDNDSDLPMADKYIVGCPARQVFTSKISSR